MREELLEHIYKTAEPDDSFVDWIIQYVLRLPYPISIDVTEEHKSELIYGAYKSIHPVDNIYLDVWNSARADLVTEFVEMPKDPQTVKTVSLPITPIGFDVSYWLCKQVLLLGDLELSALVDLPPTEIITPTRELLPVLKKSLSVLKDLRVKHEGIQAYHRARYLLIRYYLDIEYAELTS